MRTASAAAILSAAALLLPLVGCGSSSATGGATTLPVKGTVTYKGKPLTKGTVTFEPEGAGKEATGAIQPDGTFVLTTYTKDDGAVVGKHRVMVDSPDKTVPAKYAGPGTSKLEIEVSSGKNDYPIELK
jgi:hypothetical protein